MKNHLAKNTYYNVMTPAEGDTEATILIYNYIGEWWTWDPEQGYQQTGTTDIGFVTELEDLAKKYNVIHVRINCLGGEIFHGNAIVNAIRNCPVEVHTWNDGVCASMAAIIWMAGKKRHMAKNAMLMLHSASNICWGNSRDMREMADVLDQFDNSLIIGAADSLGIAEDDLRSKYFDGKDHWLSFNDVTDLGWSSTDDNYPSANPLPTNKALNYRELLAAYEQKVLAGQSPSPKNEPADQPGLIAQFKSWLDEAKAVFGGSNPSQPSSPTQEEDMNISEFKASLADGTLNLDDVKAHLESLTPATTPAATGEPGGDDDEESFVALRTELEETKAQLMALATQFKAFGAKPGEARSTPGLPTDDAPGISNGEKTAAQLLEESNQELLNAAQNGDTVMFTPAIPKA